jgi:hypothetical protein
MAKWYRSGDSGATKRSLPCGRCVRKATEDPGKLINICERVTMAPSVRNDPLPYELHTNRELEFTLDRGKPLAH